MIVRDLITALLKCDMDENVSILIEKGKAVEIWIVHNCDYRSTGVNFVTIEPVDDLKRLDE